MSEECQCGDPFGLMVCHVHDCPECSGRAGKHSTRCYLHLRDRLSTALQRVAVLERALSDHAWGRVHLACRDLEEFYLVPPPEPPEPRGGKESKP